MAAAPRAKPEDHFAADEWASLTARSSMRGLWLVAHCWGVIGAAMVILVYRIRNIAEHALVAQNEPDPLRQARTTRANLLERALLAPYWVNYHCEHHIFTSVPCWNLPRAHELLNRRGTTATMEVQPGYVTLLKLAAGP